MLSQKKCDLKLVEIHHVHRVSAEYKKETAISEIERIGLPAQLVNSFSHFSYIM